MKVITYKCDRCGKIMKDFREVEMMTLMKKTQEFCKDCSEDFKDWYNKKGIHKKRKDSQKEQKPN